jgi:hypothetical protein
VAPYSAPNTFSSGARGEGDICRGFSFILPIAVLAELFRLPEGNARRRRPT